MRRRRARPPCRPPPESALEAIPHRRTPRSRAATATHPRIRREPTIAGSLSPLGFLPQRLHFFDVRILRLLTALRQLALQESEAFAEFGVGLAQRLLGVHLQEARQVHQNEQQ